MAGPNGSSLGGGNNPNGAAGGGGGYLSSGYGYALPYGATGGSREGFIGGIAGLEHRTVRLNRRGFRRG